MIDNKDILKALDTVIDPELQLPITDMGLIYGVDVRDDDTVHILMTLTTVGCPLFDVIHDDMVRAVKTVPGVQSVDIELTFDPPWTPAMMAESARAELGID
jgi:metal-sulfur cluster biosynthetic enzyme